MDRRTKAGENLWFEYKFLFTNGDEKIFILGLDPKSMNVIRSSNHVPSEWTRLETFKCPHCPLEISKHTHCPVAENLEDIIIFFTDMPSYEKVRLQVTSYERTYFKETSVQVGVSGILGILMPTSGCPILSKLKPLVRFHLPFASIEDTQFRVLSMYLFAQYIKMKKGKHPDWEMEELKKVYDDIQILNRNVAEQISKVESKDASINAVVVLNNFANFVSIALVEEDIDYFESLFRELI